MKLIFTHVKSTKTCEVFQHGQKPDIITLYLKKVKLAAEGINPATDLIVTIKEANEHD